MVCVNCLYNRATILLQNTIIFSTIMTAFAGVLGTPQGRDADIGFKFSGNFSTIDTRPIAMEQASQTGSTPYDETDSNYSDASPGWKNKKLLMTRNYVCRYSEDGAPCWDGDRSDMYDLWPRPLHCPPGNCCSRTVNGSSTCTSQSISCVFIWRRFSYGSCACKKFNVYCPPNSECIDDEQIPFGGAYCHCRPGYIGDGVKCEPDPCFRSDMCNPGTCKTYLDGTTECQCPSGYNSVRSDDGKNLPKCVLEDQCAHDPCGPPEAVIACRSQTNLTHMCICRPGYASAVRNGSNVCVKMDTSISCADHPCGTTGLELCEDTVDGAKCICKSDHELVEHLNGWRCKYSPCREEPCGPPAAVKVCAAGISTYSCDCNSGYKSTVVNGLPKCQEEEPINIIPFVAMAGGVILLISGITFLVFKKRSQNRTIDGYMDDSLSEGVAITGDISQWM